MIAEAKRAFAAAIEAELDDIRAMIEQAAERARVAAKDAHRLNGLGTGLHGLASTLETALGQLVDVRDEARTWLEVGKEPITERTNPALVVAR